MATEQKLSAVEVLGVHDAHVLTAILRGYAYSGCEFTQDHAAIALRIAEKMGMHQLSDELKMDFPYAEKRPIE